VDKRGLDDLDFHIGDDAMNTPGIFHEILRFIF
jgi:hypothetical protein